MARDPDNPGQRMLAANLAASLADAQGIEIRADELPRVTEILGEYLELAEAVDACLVADHEGGALVFDLNGWTNQDSVSGS